MLRFTQYLEEAKNTHMTHLEDLVIDGNVEGTRQAINYLRDLRDMLAGDSKAPVNLTVKWDGAPAIFAGTDPSDGKFFVAKKGIFNKNPKVYKTPADIDAGIEGDLNKKLKLALKHLPALGIKGVIQGDFLYSKDDLRKETIDGEPHITFHPNTIVYAVPAKSELASRILASEFGVVWHTTYSGSDFESMSASFGKTIAGRLKETKAVWSVDAVYKDVSGTATMTKKETEEVTRVLSDAGRIFQKLKRSTFEGIANNDELNMRINTFINSKVREGTEIKNVKRFVSELFDYIYEWYQKKIDGMKSEKGKAGWEEKRKNVISYFSNTPTSEVEALFTLYVLIRQAKMIITKKLDQAGRIGTFLKTKNGFEVTGQEGFVAIDHMGKNAVKLVDRMQFSRANFSPEYVKGWQR